jgi:hypothetical protein
MSTDFRLQRKVRASTLLDGCLEKYGVREHIKPDETSERAKCLTDGRNYLWMYIDNDDLVGCFCRYGANCPDRILDAIANEFDTDIFPEYQPQFWGFKTQEESDAALDEMNKRAENDFYFELLKYLKGENNDIRPGTIGMLKAHIAQKLIAEQPELTLAQNKEQLLARIEEIYDREHAVHIKLTNEQMAFVRLISTHEDDLPKA